MTRFSTRARRGAVAIAMALLATIGAIGTTAAPSGAALPACTKTWTNTAGGSWDTAASWSGGTVPTTADHVCITQPGTYTVTLSAPGDLVTVASLRLGVTGTGPIAQTLVVTKGVQAGESSLTATQGMEIGSRGVLELGESADAAVAVGVGDGATIANAGTIRQATGSEESHIIRGDVVNTGTLRLDRSMRITGTLTTEGALQVNHVLHVEDTVWTKGGTVRGDWVVVAYDGLRVGDADTDTGAGSPPFTIEGGALSIESENPISVTVRNAVTLTGDSHPGQYVNVQALTGASATLTFADTWTNGGVLNLEPSVDGQATIDSVDGGPLVNEGELTRSPSMGPSSPVAVIDTALVNRGSIDLDDGKLRVWGTVENEGLLDVDRGGIEALGNVLLDPSSTVGLTIDGDRCCTPVASVGDVIVDGRLVVDTVTAPEVGASILLGKAALLGGAGGTLEGAFDELLFTGSASYDAYTTSTELTLVRRAGESATKRFVRAAFQDFLGRQPTTTELDQRAAAIDGGTLTRATFVRQLSLSPEYVTALVQRFYADTLGRPGDPDGVAFWVDQLRTGRKTVAEVAGSFYASNEYFTRAGGTNNAWITDLYDVFFDRPPTSGDLTYWTGRISARSRTRVAIELFQSLESRRQRVDRLYQDLLGRDSDAGGRDFWAARITTQGDLALAVNLAASAEYLERAQSRYP